MSLVVRKPAFCICENKDAIRIVQSLYYLNQKFQASSHRLWLYNWVCVGPGRKPLRPVFSQRGSNNIHFEGCKIQTKQSKGLHSLSFCLHPWEMQFGAVGLIIKLGWVPEVGHHSSVGYFLFKIFWFLHKLF